MSHTNKERSASQIAKAVFETLEGRQLMSSVTLSDNMLTVQATGDNPMKVWVSADRRTNQVIVWADGKKQSFDATAFSSLRIIGGAKNDSVYIEPEIKIPAHITTGAGNDKINAGGGNDVIDAGAGNDTVRGNDGNDQISGGDGNDKLYGGVGADTIDGNDGDDRIDGGSGRNTLRGGDGDDVLFGGQQTDMIDGGEGNDRLFGAGGNDDLQGGEGNDFLRGEQGDDVLDGGDGTNDVSGGAGKNVDNTRPDYRPPSPGGGNSGGGTGNTGGNGGGTSSGGSGSSGNNGGSTPTDGGNDGGSDPTPIDSSAAPKPAIEFIDANGMAGHTVHVNGLSTQLADNDKIAAKFEWDFGDNGTRFNKLTGWNAAHTYDQPGTYTVALTVTDSAGRRTKTTATVKIAADTRRVIYVDANGSDSNSGASPAQAVRTFARAGDLADDNTKILLRNGQSFNVGEPVYFNSTNLTIGTYGDGAKARMVKTEASTTTMIFLLAGSHDVVVEGIEFDSKWGLDSSYGTGKVPARALTVFGTNVTVRDCTFRNLCDAVNTLGLPKGVLVQDNSFTDEMRGYSIWGEGTDHVYLGNTMRGSRHEHLIRTSNAGVTRLLIAGNDMSRPNNNKGSIEMRVANWFYVAGNTIDGGTLRAGLQEDKKYNPDWASEHTANGVIENNHTKRIFLNIRPGVQHLAVRNNVFERDGDATIIMQATMPGYDQVRKIDDIRIEGNTGVNQADIGKFLQINGHTSHVTVKNNLYVAPKLLATGGGGAAAISIVDPSGEGLKTFTISNNVWPSVTLNSHQGGLNYVWSSWGDSRGYQAPSEWEGYSQVSGDSYRSVQLANTYQVTGPGKILVGSSLKLAA